MNERFGQRPVHRIITTFWTNRLVRGALDFAQHYDQGHLQFQWEPLELIDGSDELDCDGLIVSVESERISRNLIRKGLPVVNISGVLSPSPFPSVLSDNQQAGRLGSWRPAVWPGPTFPRMLPS